MDYPLALVNTNQAAVQIKIQQFSYLENEQLLMVKKVAKWHTGGKVSQHFE